MFIYMKNVNLTNPSSVFRQIKFFVGKSRVCDMTQFSGANESSDSDGNTNLLECADSEYVYFSGCGIINFKTDDKIIDHNSLMGNNMCPSTFALRKNTHISYNIITDLLKTIK